MMNDQYSNYPTQKQALTVVIITIVFTFFAGLLGFLLGLGITEVLLVEILTIVPALIFVSYKKYSLRHIFRLRPINWKILLTTIFAGIALTIIADEADRLVQIVFPMPEILVENIEETLKISTLYDFFIIIFSAVIFAAVCEELLFRGFLQTSLENKYDITRAIMLTALMFAIVHFNPWQTIPLIAFAIFLGVFSWKSNSIIPSMIVHFFNNGIAILFTNLDKKYIDWYLWKGHVNPAILALAGITLVIGLIKFYRYCDEYNDKKRVKSTYSDDQNRNYPIS
jgi:membrane protease YdiL (CAAX protease family)